MEDAGYTVFMGFGGLWVLMGIVAVTFLFKSDGQKLKFGKWGLLVAIPDGVTLHNPGQTGHTR